MQKSKSAPKKKAKKKNKRTVRLYAKLVLNPDESINQDRSVWNTVPFSDGMKRLELPIKMDDAFIGEAKQGSPYECIIANGIRAVAEADPDFFPHPYIYVHVVRTAVYIVDRKKNGQPSHAVRYMHGFSKLTKTFDTATKAQFRKLYPDDDFVLTLKPGRKYRAGESKVGGNGKGGSRSHSYSRGAQGRAIAAGLFPAVAFAA